MGVLHATIVGGLPGARVVAVCDTKFVVRALAGRALPRIHVGSDVSDLGRVGVDAVYVTTLPGSHHALVDRVLSDRIAKNVFVEKSLASTASEAREMVRLAREHASITMVGYQKRFAVTFKKAKELLDQGALGEIHSFDAYAYSSDFVGAAREAAPAVSRGGVLRDSGCHAIDVALWYFGDLDVVEGSHGIGVAEDIAAEVDGGSVPEDFVFARVKAARGVDGSFRVSSQMEGYRLPEIGLTVTGSRGVLSVNEDRVEVSATGDDVERWHRHDLGDQVPFSFGAPEYARESIAFVNAVGNREPDSGAADFEAGARVEEVIDRIVELCA